VEAIIQGMQAHVGVAAVQKHGAGALWSLTANGTLWHHLWWRCVLCGARRVAAGRRVLLVGIAPSATCTHVTQRHRHGSHPCVHLLPRVAVACWVLAMWGHSLTCPWVGVGCAADNRVTIAAAGGVEAIVQGMQPHAGVAGVQLHGVRALRNLAMNGASWRLLWWRCVVRGAWLAAAGGCACLFVSHHLPAAQV